MAKRETDIIMGPPSFASAAINGDHSGMTCRDEVAYIDWLVFNVPDGWDIVDVGDEPGFSWNCRVHGLPWSGGELVEYTIMNFKRYN